MINLPFETCFGCYGCQNICPKDAISLLPDKYGYKHPIINHLKCIECHLCEKICTSLHPLKLNTPQKILAAISKNEEDYKTTASGGFCTVLSYNIIKNGGVVYGSAEEDYTCIHHIRVSKISDLARLKKSKYVHSDVGLIYKDIKNELLKGVKVLFIGTPCQVSGLLGYLGKAYENLLTIDLVCHGVPSQQMLISHINSLKAIPKKVKKGGIVDFRWKTSNRIHSGIRFCKDGEILYKREDFEDAYMAAFTYGISCRDNCYTCPFAKSDRIGDITAADFWGIGEEIASEFKDINGVSLVMLNSNKGQEAFKEVEERFFIEIHSLEEAKARNKNLKHPSPKPPKRDLFLKLYEEEGMHFASKECIPLYRRNCNLIYRFLKSIPGLKSAYILTKMKILNSVHRIKF